MLNLKKKAAGGVKWTGISTVITALLKFIQITVLARFLNPEAFGLMAIVIILIGFAKLFGETGLSESVIQKMNPTENQLSSIYWITLLFGFLAFSLFYFGAEYFAALWKMPELESLIKVSSITLILGALGNQFQALLRKEIRFDELAFIDIISVLLGTIVAILSAWKFDQDVWSFVWGLIVTVLLRTIFLFFIAIKNNYLPKLYFKFSEIKEFISFGLYRSGGLAANYFNTRIDQLLIGDYMGADTLGKYNLAANITGEPASRINPMITRVAFPILTRVQNDKLKLKKGFLKIINILMLINGPIFLGIAVLAPIFVPVLFGNQWIETIPLIQILSFVALTKTFGSSNGVLLLSKGYANWSFYWNMSNLAVTPLVVYFASKSGDVLIVAWSLLLLKSVYLVFMYQLMLKKIIGSFVKDLLRTSGLTLAIISLVSLASFFLIRVFELEPSLIHLVSLTIFALILMTILLLTFQRKFIVDTYQLLLNKN